MAQVGDKVIFHPGTTGHAEEEATITAVHEDRSVDIVYPHHANAEFMATADRCQWGAGIYQVCLPGTAPAAAAPVAEPNVALESLQAEMERLQGEVAAAQVAKEAAEAEGARVVAALAEATARADASQAELAAMKNVQPRPSETPKAPKPEKPAKS